MKRLQDTVKAKQVELRSTKKVVEVAKKVAAQLQLKTKCMRKQLSESSTSKLKTTMELGEAKDAAQALRKDNEFLQKDLDESS